MSALAQLCLELLKRCLAVLFGIGSYAAPSPALISKTQEVFARRLKRPVNEQEAREIIREFRNLFSLLKEIRHGK